MTPSEADILHVSDTALMVAACRAMETARPNGLVRDPFAEELAGPRGMAMARALPRSEMMCFGVGIRSRFLDELVADAVTVRQVATVLCLGSGLDTRPWRLDLPADLRWIEADFPAMIDYKTARMAGHPPKCRLVHMAADVTDPSARGALFAAVGSAPALLITEGLLMYLPAETIEALSVEAAAKSGIRYWLMDLATEGFAKRVMDSYGSIQKLRDPTHLHGEQILEILTRNGWTTVRRLDYTMDAWRSAPERIAELMRNRPANEPMEPPPLNDPSGVHLFGRGGA